MSKCVIIAILKLMWAHSSLDMNEQDRINAIENTELIYNYSIENNFDPFATFSIVYNESRFRQLKDLNTASCGAFQIAYKYIDEKEAMTCEKLKDFRISLEIAFEYHIEVYMNELKYAFKEQDILNKDYKTPSKLQELFRRYAAGPNCKNKEDQCYKDSEKKAKQRVSTRNMLHKIFLENYKKYSTYIHLVDKQKCTN